MTQCLNVLRQAGLTPSAAGVEKMLPDATVAGYVELQNRFEFPDWFGLIQFARQKLSRNADFQNYLRQTEALYQAIAEVSGRSVIVDSYNTAGHSQGLYAEGINGLQHPKSTGYAPTYYPGTPNAAEAQLVAIAVGESKNDLTVLLAAVKTARVTGTALGAEGQPLRGGNVMVTQTMRGGGDMAMTFMSTSGSTIKPDGSFTISGVAPGEYQLRAMAFGAGPAMFRYWSGLYRREDRALFVSNGVGNWLPLRTRAPAEIVHLTLRRSL